MRGLATKLRGLKQRLTPVERAGSTVLFHVGRSGSSVLARMLGQHPRIHWDGELYERHFRAWERRHGRGFLALDAPDRPIDLLARRQHLAGSDWYGFEVKFFHLRLFNTALEAYLERLEELGVRRFVVLERRNLLRKIVSSVIAHQAGRFHHEAGAAPVPRRARIDVHDVGIDRERADLMGLLDGYRSDFAHLRSLLMERESLHLTYEDDVSEDPLRAYARVLDFLELPYFPAEVTLSRTNPYPLAQLIENLDEVTARLRGTPYAWMLDA